MKEFTSKKPDDTKKIAASLRELYPNHNLILLSGELGSGKTTFAKGLASQFGMEEREIKSPTYTLFREYEGLLHVDLYRLESPDELLVDQIHAFAEKGGTVVIEWPEIILNLIKNPHLHIEIKGGDERKIKITEKL